MSYRFYIFGLPLQYFFGANSEFFSSERITSAIRRLNEMTDVIASLENEPFERVDLKYGVHGGHRNREGTKTLFYCGGAQGFLNTGLNFRYSTFGLFLAKSLFPDFEGTIEINSGIVEISAIALTNETLKKATERDLLVVHSHQFCSVDVESFPGYQLHINVRVACRLILCASLKDDLIVLIICHRLNHTIFTRLIMTTSMGN